MNPAIAGALLAAALFGASTPVAKSLAGEMSPVLLAGLLYLGSGVGLSAAWLLRDRGWRASGLAAGDFRWLAGAILVGGLLAPVLLIHGLARSSGAAASLLLNLEAVFTALLAWLVFRENAGARVVLGMLAIGAGGVVLAWPSQEVADGRGLGALAVGAACLCWALDNNLTRRIASADALFIAAAKGLVAGTVNTALAIASGAALPHIGPAFAALGAGLFGYGLSLVLFVVALRELGAARTGAYFATAPFIGAALAIPMLGEPAPPALWLAAALMGAGVWLHLSERHEHEHTHEPIAHAHRHVHDVHHRHDHDFAWDGREPHAHPHRHEPLTHRHPHYPDAHHLHRH